MRQVLKWFCPNHRSQARLITRADCFVGDSFGAFHRLFVAANVDNLREEKVNAEGTRLRFRGWQFQWQRRGALTVGCSSTKLIAMSCVSGLCVTKEYTARLVALGSFSFLRPPPPRFPFWLKGIRWKFDERKNAIYKWLVTVRYLS